jgi:two-component system chemotaxis sensor kinase CheA
VGADRRFVMLFELGLDGLREDFLPREVCLEQMPKRLVRGARQFDCRYLPIDEEGRLLGLLLAIDDVTELLARAREDAEQRELLAAFEALMRDKNGFFTFFEEAEQLFAQLAGDHVDPALQKRLLHTLKGSAGTFGLRLLAELCHQAESDLEQGGTCAETLGQLRTRWAEIVSTLRAIAPTVGKTIEVSEPELAYLTERARQGAAAEELVEELRRLGWEPSERALGRLAQHARGLASRLGKGSLEVQVDADDTRLEPERWAPLWSALVQVVRNAVDHGIEPPEQRIAEGKPAVGRLRLAARRSELGYQLEIEDDGRGIDWETIRRGCEQRGRPSATRADLVAAILSPDFSTRAHVTETSGRGIGLSLLDRAVRDLSGQLALESEPKRGTRWVLTFPSLGSTASSQGPLRSDD